MRIERLVAIAVGVVALGALDLVMKTRKIGKNKKSKKTEATTDKAEEKAACDG